MQSNIRPLNQFKIVYYPAGKPDGLVAGHATTIEDARRIANERHPATIWDTWNREAGKDGKRHYHAILVAWTTGGSKP